MHSLLSRSNHLASGLGLCLVKLLLGLSLLLPGPGSIPRLVPEPRKMLDRCRGIILGRSVVPRF